MKNICNIISNAFLLKKKTNFRIMKIIFLLIVLACFSVSANVSSQSISLNKDMNNMSIKSVLKFIEKRSDYRFFYSDDFNVINKKVNLKAQSSDIETLMGQVFQNTSATVEYMEGNVVIITPFAQQQQRITITGTVSDKGGPLPGASITVKGTTIGTTSDAGGAYSIDVPSDNAVLVFSYIGYTTRESPVGSRRTISIELSEDVQVMDEIVVIGYGSRTKKDLTGAVSQIGSKDITRQVAISPQFAMQGKMAGIMVSNTGSSPVARPEVRIRGVSTLGYNDPLYVVDGVPLTEGGASSTDAGSIDLRGGVNVFTMINPNDIESISVLKDASATAIYGVRASNGVILITTKRGSEGKPRVDFSVNYGIQNIYKRYDVVSMQETLDMAMTAMNANTAFTKDYWYPLYDKSSSWYMGGSRDYSQEWMDAYLNKNAAIQDYNITVAGGSKASNYAVGAGYANQEDAVFKDGFQRYSFFVNSDHQLTKWLKLGESYRFVYTNFDDHSAPSGEGGFRDISLINPWQPLYDSSREDGFALPGRDIEGVFRGYGYGPSTQNNFLGTDKYVVSKRNMMRNLGTFYAELSPIEGLRFRGTFSFDYYTNNRDSYNEMERGFFEISRDTPTPYIESGNTYGIRQRTNINLIKEFLIAYTNKFGKHSVDLILNAMHQDIKYNSLQAAIERGSPIPSWDQAYINEGWPAENKNLFYTKNDAGLIGYMGRLSYHYDSRYYLDATIRRDGSSKFGPGYKWGTFPSFAGAWRISSEGFLKDVAWINDLKIRGGWGQSGNQETRDFAFLSIVNFNPKAGFGSNAEGDGTIYPAAVLGDFPVVDMSWETVSTFSAGFDLMAWQNKLNFTAEFYNRNTDGILQGIVIPWTIGSLNSPVVNLAKVNNRGFEFQAGYNDRFGDIGVNASANFTTVRNRVSDLFRNQPQSGGTDLRIENGYTMNYIYGFKTDGIFQTEAEIEAYKKTTDDVGNAEQKAPGDYRFVDLYGAPKDTDPEGALKNYAPDGRVNDYDKTYLGKTIPGYYYGISLGADYKNWDIILGFRGVGDVQRICTIGLNSMGVGQRYYADYRNAWTPQNTSTNVPRLIQNDPSKNNRISSRHVQDAGFFRFQNFQIGYNIDPGLLNKVGISRFRCYISGSNLFVISPYNDLDPENITTPTSFSIGANFSF
jgi:TonB-linked SusC/RagA family outer membrane protein